MRKQYLAAGLTLSAFLIALLSFGQDPSPADSPTPTPSPPPPLSPSPTPTSPPVLISTATPTLTPISTASLTPTITPNQVGTVAVPSTLLSSPTNGSPSPSATPIGVQAAGLGESSLGWSEKGAPVFTLSQAVITALQQNPDVLRALGEIKRTKSGVI